MRTTLLLMTIAVLAFTAGCGSQGAQGDAAALKLADDVVKAAGGDAWPTVKRIRFSFDVLGADGKLATSAKHDWDVRAKTDTVTWNNQTVTVSLPTSDTSEPAKKAYQRWVNDTYWLLAPLKVKDAGVKLTHGGAQTVDGKPVEVLRLAFAGVGLTPGDQYNLYVDRDTHLVRRWDYIPNPQKTVSGNWDQHKKFGPLTISTDRPFGERRIQLNDIVVETD